MESTSYCKFLSRPIAKNCHGGVGPTALPLCVNPNFNLVFTQQMKLLPNETGNKFIVYSGRKTTTADGIKVLPFDTPLTANG